jgi:hypothetical protein
MPLHCKVKSASFLQPLRRSGSASVRTAFFAVFTMGNYTTQLFLGLTLAITLGQLRFSRAGFCQAVPPLTGAIVPATDPGERSPFSPPSVSQSATDLTLLPQQFDRAAVAQEPALAQETPAVQEPPAASETLATPAERLDLNPQIIEDSPVLQRWLEEIPDLRSEIRHDPGFRTRLRLGYARFSPDNHANGFNVGVEDVRIGRTNLTVSGDYQGTFDGSRQTYGADLRYYVLPLGSNVNVAPVVGYRHVAIDSNTTDGINLGLRLLLSLSRTGAADIALSQSWVAPGTETEVGLTTLSFGYALTHHLRISTDLQKQNSPQSKDSRVGIVLEWML